MKILNHSKRKFRNNLIENMTQGFDHMKSNNFGQNFLKIMIVDKNNQLHCDAQS